MQGDPFSMDFSTMEYDQLVFMTGDCKKWVKIQKCQFTGEDCPIGT